MKANPPYALFSTLDFTAPARKRWEASLPDVRRQLLVNVWCGHCRREATITNFTGAIKDGDLLLVDRCAECQGNVARMIEAG
jgi:bacterioferritin-associated ferredoxin